MSPAGLKKTHLSFTHPISFFFFFLPTQRGSHKTQLGLLKSLPPPPSQAQPWEEAIYTPAMGEAASSEGCICAGCTSPSTPSHEIFLLRVLPKAAWPAISKVAVNTKPFYLWAAASLPIQLKNQVGLWGSKHSAPPQQVNQMACAARRWLPGTGNG